ncbi:molecular chaperone DnaJ [Marichromatium purpuratum 984]|uniref:Molecular chaperone DnaJ n=1 Tax=Marichromatium purpuratum 984 TaxID=765910 RepID=W0DW87_MARPU|nr:co-chaperone DjlA [Marichromatium purpuratum]AHF02687.1 molecular chaperone DnaJ [Marichromatium purpuratum 984]
MRWFGTAVAGGLGLVFGGPLGALFGAALGRGVDRGWGGVGGERLTLEQRSRIQQSLFEGGFRIMGYLAKVDGRVSEGEIAQAESVMTEMGLGAPQRQAAIALFNAGKASTFDLSAEVAALREVIAGRRVLARPLLEVALAMAYVDGPPSRAQRAALETIRRGLAMSGAVYRRIELVVSLRRRSRERAGTSSAAGAAPRRQPALAGAYALLGVRARASDAEVKQAYRRLMSRHHPDKLVSRGASEAQVRAASRKTQEIRRAYETITRARG